MVGTRVASVRRKAWAAFDVSEPVPGSPFGAPTALAGLAHAPVPDAMGMDARYASRLPDAHRHVLKLYSALGVFAAFGAGAFALGLGRFAFDSLGMGVVLGVFAALFVLNLHRLGFAGAALPAHARVEEADTWRPSVVMGTVTAALGGLLVQVPAAWLVVRFHPEGMEERREAFVQDFAASIASSFDQRLANVDEALSGFSKGADGEASPVAAPDAVDAPDAAPVSAAPVAGAPPEVAAPYAEARLQAVMAERDAILVEREVTLARDVAAYRARVADLPMAAMRVSVAWNHPVYMLLLTVLAMLWVGAPALLRAYRPASIRAYARERLHDERARIVAHHADGEARAVAALIRWPTFSGRLDHRFEDPPFNTVPLVLGRYMGTVEATTDERTLMAEIPGFAAARAERPEPSAELEALDGAVRIAAGELGSAHARGPRWELVRALLARRAAGDAADERRPAIDAWVLRELATLCRGVPTAVAHEEIVRELATSPIGVSLVSSCGNCGSEASPGDVECAMCAEALVSTLSVGEHRVPLERLAATA